MWQLAKGFYAPEWRILAVYGGAPSLGLLSLTAYAFVETAEALLGRPTRSVCGYGTALMIG